MAFFTPNTPGGGSPGSGTVTVVSVATANGFSGTVANDTSTPAITIIAGAITPTSVNGLTISTTTGTLTMTNGKTLAVTNSLTLSGTDSTVMTFPSTSATIARTDAGQTFTGTQTFGALVATTVNGNTFTTGSSTYTGTAGQTYTFPTTSATIARTDAANTFTGTQTFTAPVLGTPASVTLTNATGLPAAAIVPGTLAAGAYVLAENASVQLDPAGSADGKFSGITVTATAGYTQAFGDLVYIDPTDSRWEATDANSAAGADGDARGTLAIVVVPGTDGTACTLMLQGIIRADAKFPTFTVNNPIYVSETAGLVTGTQPSTSGVVIRTVGFGLTGDEMYFNPSPDYITHA